MKRCYIILVLLAFTLISLDVSSKNFGRESTDFSKIIVSGKNDTSAFYNSRGFEAYKKNDINTAALYFLYAITKDETNKLAHYNYACMLSILRKNLSICEYEYIDEIEHHLAASIMIDSKRRDRMKNDPDLKHLREYPFFIQLSLDPALPLAQLLCDARVWYGPKPGVFPASPEILFSKNGTVVARIFEFVDTEEGSSNWKELRGRWKLSGSTVTIQFDAVLKNPITGTIHIKTERGVVKAFWIDFGEMGKVTLDSDPCSA